MKKYTIVDVALFAETIMRHFDEVVKGMASDMAYYEVLAKSEEYLAKPNKGFEEYLDFTLNIDKKALVKIKKQWQTRMKEMAKFVL